MIIVATVVSAINKASKVNVRTLIFISIPPSRIESSRSRGMQKDARGLGVFGALRRQIHLAFTSYGLYRRPRNSTGSRFCQSGALAEPHGLSPPIGNRLTPTA